MATILVTGETGTPGRKVVSWLAVRQHCIRILSHQARREMLQQAVSAAREGRTGHCEAGEKRFGNVLYATLSAGTWSSASGEHNGHHFYTARGAGYDEHCGRVACRRRPAGQQAQHILHNNTIHP